MKCVCVVAFLLSLQGVQCWWPFSSSDPRSESSAVEEAKRPITFEINSVEQKFLAEAQHFLDLPQLDQCQHGVGYPTACVTIITVYVGDLSPEGLLWFSA